MWLWRRNDVATSFWRHNDVIIASCVRWDSSGSGHGLTPSLSLDSYSEWVLHCIGCHLLISPVNSPHKGPATREMFPLDVVIMDSCSGDQNEVWTKQFTFCRRHFQVHLAQGTVVFWFKFLWSFYLTYRFAKSDVVLTMESWREETPTNQLEKLNGMYVTFDATVAKRSN